MKSPFVKLAAAMLGCVVAVALPGAVNAQSKWPDRPVRVINPFTPGGTSDLIMRIFSERLEKALGQPVIIENRPGAGGSIGQAAVAQAAPDGYTLLITTTGPAAIAQVLFKKPPYDVNNDFTYIYMFGGSPILLAVGAKSPIRSMSDYVAAAKKGGVSFSNSGTGSVGHLTGLFFAGEAGVKLLHVPYKGAPEAQAGVVSGEVTSIWNTLGAHVGALKGGDLRGIAVTSQERARDFPDIPTVRESGFPDVVITNWFLLAGPAKMPEDIVRRLNDVLTGIGKEPAIMERLQQLGLAPIPGLTLKAYASFIKQEVGRWSKVMEEHSIPRQ